MGENKMEGKVRIWGWDCKSDMGKWKETKIGNDMKMSIFTGKAWTN
jgi:hypothetical protein